MQGGVVGILDKMVGVVGMFSGKAGGLSSIGLGIITGLLGSSPEEDKSQWLRARTDLAWFIRR